MLIVFSDCCSKYQSRKVQLLIVSGSSICVFYGFNDFYFPVLKGESPAKRGAKRKPTESVVRSDFLALTTYLQ